MYRKVDTNRKRASVGWILGLGVAAWLVFGLLVAPPIIEDAYRGDRFLWLHRLFADYPSRPLRFFLEQWRGMVIYGTLGGLAFAAFAYVMRTPKIARRVVGRATPGTLGAIRALVCGILLMSTLWEDLPSTALLPRDLAGPMGVMALFHLVPGFEDFAASPTALALFQGGTAVVLFLGMIGWKTRWVLPVGAVCYLVLGGLLRQYAWFYHTGLVPLYLLAVLALTGIAGEGGSVDRLRRLWKGRPVPPADKATFRYGWARYALWTTFALPYVAAGLSKLRNGGFFWWEAVSFEHILLRNAVHPMEFDFDASLLLLHAPDALVAALGGTALLGELLYGLVLFSRRARWVMPVVMAGMHVGILFMQNILFFDLLLLQLMFLRFTPLRKAVGRRLATRWGRIRLTYNAASERPVRAVRVLRALDLFERVEWISVSEEEKRAGALSARYRGRTYRGASLWRLLARSLPALWPLLPLLYLPGVPAAVARCFARKEAKPPDAGAQQAAWFPKRTTWIATPRLTLAVAALLTCCWVLRVELYPLTAMQMFSKKRGPVMTYKTVTAHLRNGAVMEAPIREGIGAMADGRYRRLLGMAFDPKREHLTRQVFRTFAARWNRQVPPKRQVTEIEVQRRRWAFRAVPDDPDHGQTVARKVFPLKAMPTQTRKQDEQSR